LFDAPTVVDQAGVVLDQLLQETGPSSTRSEFGTT
jgi:hypothetical protein